MGKGARDISTGRPIPDRTVYGEMGYVSLRTVFSGRLLLAWICWERLHLEPPAGFMEWMAKLIWGKGVFVVKAFV